MEGYILVLVSNFCQYIIEHIKLISFKIKQKKKNVVFGTRAYANASSMFEGYNKIGAYSYIKDTKMGYASYCGKNCKLYNANIGKYSSIGANVMIIRGQHPIDKNVSTHPAFFSTRKQCGMTYVNQDFFEEEKWIDAEHYYSVLIGNDVWIGSNVSILEGVKIGNGAVIGAGAVVTQNIEPYEICGGIPAKRIRKRFTQQQIDFLEKDQWWDKNESWIREHVKVFMDIDNYIDIMSKAEY